MSNINYGKLYIVATPIGNLGDMTFRAIDTLKSVDIIMAEDTRRTKELLNYFEIKKECTSYNEHTSRDKINKLIDNLKNGKNIALVSDAGTPLISDPGKIFVKIAIENDIEITSIPGACAAINALVLSGIDNKNFLFIGFLSDNKKEKEKQLKKLLNTADTSIIYVSSHNLIKDLELLIDILGGSRYASISREMTKKYEETIRGSLKDIYDYFINEDIRGEFVLVLSGIDENDLQNKNFWSKMDINEHFNYYKELGMTDKEALKMIAHDREIGKSDVYKEIKIKRN